MMSMVLMMLMVLMMMNRTRQLSGWLLGEGELS